MHNRFCQLLDPWRTLTFQSSWLDFKDIWIVIYNMHRRPEMGEKECDLKKKMNRKWNYGIILF